MCNQENIRREAFRHLDDFVRGELPYIVDINLPLESLIWEICLKTIPPKKRDL